MNQSSSHHMYFLAILCPVELDKKIRQYKIWMKEHFGTVVALKSMAHITLVQPFWLEEQREENLRRTLASFASDMDELEIRLDGFSHFGKRVLFARVEENPSLEELKQQVENHFVLSFSDCLRKDNRPFHPHVTIATRDLKPGDFDKAWKHFSGETWVEKFHTRSVSLLRLEAGRWNEIAVKKW